MVLQHVLGAPSISPPVAEQHSSASHAEDDVAHTPADLHTLAGKKAWHALRLMQCDGQHMWVVQATVSSHCTYTAMHSMLTQQACSPCKGNQQ